MEQPTKKSRTKYDKRIDEGLEQYYKDVAIFQTKKKRDTEKYDAMIKAEIEATIALWRKFPTDEWFRVLNHFHIPSHEAYADANDPRYHQMPYTLDDSRHTSEELMRELLTALYDAPKHKLESYYLLSLRYSNPGKRKQVLDLLRAQKFTTGGVDCEFYDSFRVCLLFTDTQYIQEC